MYDPPGERMFRDVYVKSHLRAFPYVAGLFCGYLYINLKKSEYKMSVVGAYLIYITYPTYFLSAAEFKTQEKKSA